MFFLSPEIYFLERKEWGFGADFVYVTYPLGLMVMARRGINKQFNYLKTDIFGGD